MKQRFTRLLIVLGILFLSILNGNSQVLYVGANYHPHDDKNIEKIKGGKFASGLGVSSV